MYAEGGEEMTELECPDGDEFDYENDCMDCGRRSDCLACKMWEMTQEK